jgi:predicted DNA binding CopG/RHH family protein
MNNYIDQEEQELIESLHSKQWVPNPDENLNAQYEKYALNSLEFNNKVIVKLSERDLQKIKAKAIQEGISYQALISLLVHKYNEGKVGIKEF